MAMPIPRTLVFHMDQELIVAQAKDHNWCDFHILTTDDFGTKFYGAEQVKLIIIKRSSANNGLREFFKDFINKFEATLKEALIAMTVYGLEYHVYTACGKVYAEHSDHSSENGYGSSAESIVHSERNFIIYSALDRMMNKIIKRQEEAKEEVHLFDLVTEVLNTGLFGEMVLTSYRMPKE